ncbi:MAG: putative S-adenosylmethionine-dependent methyltransferase [Clostridia bacterium]|jgi:ubiquinone/menaquinone biosynthesis C-methylase UbiE|nr:putative S-adenosylmethionine-dependent methyltransferase [Clostridia bacterium]
MDNKSKKSISNYNKKAKNYESTFEGRFTLPFNNFICDNISVEDNLSVLDVACGSGRLLKMLSQKAKINAYGIDISDEMVKIAKEKNPDMYFAFGSADKIPFENNKFDIITVCCAFHHFTQPDKFMKEANRILKSGGRLLIAEPYSTAIIRQLENLILPLLPMGDVRLYSKNELQVFFEKADFKNITIKQDKNQLLTEGIKL